MARPRRRPSKENPMPDREPSERPDPTARLDPAAVCTLPPDALDERIEWIRREIVAHAESVARRDDALSIELASRPGLPESIDRLIELERACCSGIGFERSAGARPGTTRLEIRGVDPDAAIFRDLNPSQTSASPRSEVGGRLAKSAGLGVAASFFVCCVVPIAAVAAVGPAAASLASLDTPLSMGAVALGVGAGAWWWIGRRKADADCGC
jgi:hypothetical protein